ncbi:hypothetical protein [Bradyrhizobium symbiodeficiens]|nr:hypothetical protein [Bradyrhizobium symbiodeficiens]
MKNVARAAKDSVEAASLGPSSALCRDAAEGGYVTALMFSVPCIAV